MNVEYQRDEIDDAEWNDLCDRQDNLVRRRPRLLLAFKYSPDIYDAAKGRFSADFFPGGPDRFFRLDHDNYEKALRALLSIEETHNSIIRRQYDLENQTIMLRRRPAGEADRDFTDSQNHVWYIKCGLQARSISATRMTQEDSFVLERRFKNCERRIHHIEDGFAVSKLKHTELGGRQLEESDWIDNVTLVKSKKYLEFQHKAIDEMIANNPPGSNFREGLISDFDHQMRPTLEPMIDFAATNSPELQADLAECNPRQRLAVKNMIEGRCRPKPFLLFGPPGTGKTFTLVKAVGQILARNKRVTVLVSVQLNVCADDLAERLSNSRLIDAGQMIRLMSRHSFEALPKPRPFQCFRWPERTPRLCITTHIRNGEWHARNHRFDYVIVDNAERASEPTVLITLNKLRWRGCVVLVGDHHQLQPSIISAAAKYGLKRSMFERLIGTDIYRDNPVYRVDLTESYRSDPRISNCLSQLSYRGVEMVSRAERTSPDLLRPLVDRFGPEFTQPVVFLHVDGTQRQWEGANMYNIEEALKCVDLVRALDEIAPCSIGVVSPYKLQTFVIVQAYDRSVEFGVGGMYDFPTEAESEKINTWNFAAGTSISRRMSSGSIFATGQVEAFQGQERDVVIISAASTRGEPEPFIEDRNWLNMAVSRARKLVIVVGHRDTLEHCDFWREYLDHVDAHLHDPAS